MEIWMQQIEREKEKRDKWTSREIEQRTGRKIFCFKLNFWYLKEGKLKGNWSLESTKMVCFCEVSIIHFSDFSLVSIFRQSSFVIHRQIFTETVNAPNAHQKSDNSKSITWIKRKSASGWLSNKKVRNKEEESHGPFSSPKRHSSPLFPSFSLLRPLHTLNIASGGTREMSEHTIALHPSRGDS